MASVTVRIDGVEYGPFSVATEGVRYVAVEGAGFGDRTHLDIDDVAIGTVGYGSSDLLSADMSSGPIPPFTTEISDVGSGSAGLSGGVLAIDIDSDGNQYTLEKDLGSDTGPPLYLQLKVRFKADMLSSATAVELAYLVPAAGGGLFLSVRPGDDDWRLQEGVTVHDFGGPLAADTWYTVDVRISSGTPPPPDNDLLEDATAINVPALLLPPACGSAPVVDATYTSSLSGSTYGATSDEDDDLPDGAQGGSVWWQLVFFQPGPLVLTLDGNGDSYYAALFRSSVDEPMTADLDLVGSGTGSTVVLEVDVEIGDVVWLVVAGNESDPAGSFDVTLDLPSYWLATFDTIQGAEQLGANLNVNAIAETADVGDHNLAQLARTFTADTDFSDYACAIAVHEGEVWAAWTELDAAALPTRQGLGPYVARWDGAAWDTSAAFESDPAAYPAHLELASDGAGALYLAYSILTAGSPGGSSRTLKVKVWKHEGGWMLLDTLDTSTDTSEFMAGQLALAAYNGEVYVAWYERGSGGIDAMPCYGLDGASSFVDLLSEDLRRQGRIVSLAHSAGGPLAIFPGMTGGVFDDELVVADAATGATIRTVAPGDFGATNVNGTRHGPAISQPFTDEDGDWLYVQPVSTLAISEGNWVFRLSTDGTTIADVRGDLWLNDLHNSDDEAWDSQGGPAGYGTSIIYDPASVKPVWIHQVDQPAAPGPTATGNGVQEGYFGWLTPMCTHPHFDHERAWRWFNYALPTIKVPADPGSQVGGSRACLLGDTLYTVHQHNAVISGNVRYPTRVYRWTIGRLCGYCLLPGARDAGPIGIRYVGVQQPGSVE